MTFVFYISGHGFGHASREVEVINALGDLRPDARIVIRSAVSPSLLTRTIRHAYDLRPGACDSGIVQSTSVAHDDEATVRAAIEFYSTFETRIASEAAALASDDVAVVVGDVPPLAFEVAAALGVPSVAIANFTWDWIYEEHPGLVDAAPWLVPRLRSAYGKTTLALELPFSGGLGVFPSVRSISLIARRATRSRDDTRRHFGVPVDRPAALLSFGGYGLPSLDLSQVDASRWSLVVTDRVQPSGPSRHGQVVPIREDEFQGGGFRYEDLLAAADAVVTKPGFGIIAECAANDTPLLYTSRGHFREYDVLVSEMPTYLRCRFISQTDLFAGRWQASLDALVAQPPPPSRLSADGAAQAAAIISDVGDAAARAV